MYLVSMAQRQRRATARSPPSSRLATAPPHPHCCPAGFGFLASNEPACLRRLYDAAPSRALRQREQLLQARREDSARIAPCPLDEGKVCSFIFVCVFIYGALNCVPLSFCLPNAGKARQSKRGNQWWPRRCCAAAPFRRRSSSCLVAVLVVGRHGRRAGMRMAQQRLLARVRRWPFSPK